MFVGLLIRSDRKCLLIQNYIVIISVSPLVIASINARLMTFDSFTDTVTPISPISTGSSGVCNGSGSRVLTALVEQGYSPKIFNYIDKASRPPFLHRRNPDIRLLQLHQTFRQRRRCL
jgi:amino acid transporter